MPSIILSPHEARAAATGTLRQLWRPIVRVKRLGAVTEFQKSDTRGFDWIMRDERMLWNDLRHDDLLQRAPFRPGDVLACREAWCTPIDTNEKPAVYRADYPACVPKQYENIPPGNSLKWESPSTMPAWAVRSWIKVQTVAVKRVQEMTEGDAAAWGCADTTACMLLNTRIARRGATWDKNPWCWSYAVEQAGRPS